MSKLLDELILCGCKDMNVTMERFTNDEEFFLEIVRSMVNDKGFARLGDEIKAEDIKNAFETAHMLKGIIVNCGITPMSVLIVEIVEPLRSNTMDGVSENDTLLMEKRKMIADIVQKY